MKLWLMPYAIYCVDLEGLNTSLKTERLSSTSYSWVVFASSSCKEHHRLAIACIDPEVYERISGKVFWTDATES